MQYCDVVCGRFLDRPNRFVAHVALHGEIVTAHVKNTGRCGELLLPGRRVWLEDFTDRMGTRKLAYDLIAVDKDGLLVNMDSQSPNKAAREAFEQGLIPVRGLGKPVHVQPERTYRDSRIDFLLTDADGKSAYVEVKGVTLENQGFCSFPDAPTERGIKHLHTLMQALDEGNAAAVLFVVQMAGMCSFSPNDERHPAFGEALRAAAAHGVQILAWECDVTPDTMTIVRPIPVIL